MCCFFTRETRKKFSIKLSHSFYESLSIILNEERENSKSYVRYLRRNPRKLSLGRNKRTNPPSAIKWTSFADEHKRRIKIKIARGVRGSSKTIVVQIVKTHKKVPDWKGIKSFFRSQTKFMSFRFFSFSYIWV